MPMRMTRPLLMVLFGLSALSGCDGGAGSDGDPFVSWTVRATAGAGGSITPSSQTVGDGASVTLRVTPDDGYGVEEVTGCGGVFDVANNTYSIGEVRYTCLVTASFSPTSYNVTAIAGPNGTIDPGTVSLDHLGIATFDVAPDAGYGIAGVTGCGGTLVGGTYTTGEVTADCTVEASFDTGYSIGGQLDLLPAEGVSIVLRNNGGDDLTLTATGPFTFDLPIVDGGDYAVTIAKQPGGQECSVTSGSGQVAGAAVTTVQVGGCTYVPPAAPEVTLDYGIKELQFTWPAVEGATHYRLMEDPTGDSVFTKVGADLTTTEVNHQIALYRRVNARYQVKACNDAGCTASEVISLAEHLVPAVGYFKASNTGEGDWFGYSVALSGDGSTLAVGATGEDSGTISNQSDDSADATGAVYVFVRTDAGWSQQAYLKGEYTSSKDEFGNALALSQDGGILAVGAYSEDRNSVGIDDGTGTDNTNYDSGAVYVFIRSGTAWNQDAYIKASNTGSDDRFGGSVALSDDGATLAVGAYREDSADPADPANNDADNSGAAYVFTRSALGVWSQQAYLKASTIDAGDYFGWSVALAGGGTTLAVGARYEQSSAKDVNGDQTNNSVNNSGAAYVFTRDEVGVWTQQAYIKASNTDVDDEFGWSVALDAVGDTLAVGAYLEDSSATDINNNILQSNDDVLNSGAVYLFTRATDGSWSQQAYIKASNTGAADRFGYSVALSADGNTLAVGAAREDSAAVGIEGDQSDDSMTSAGAAYVFSRVDGLWSQQAYVKPSNSGESDKFGGGSVELSGGYVVMHSGSIALSDDGDTLAVGALREDGDAIGVDSDQTSDSAPESGAVYLF